MPSEQELLVLSAADVRSLLDVDLAIGSQQLAFESLGRGEAVLPARLLIEGDKDSVSFCYAARLAPDAGAVCKFERQPRQREPWHTHDLCAGHRPRR